MNFSLLHNIASVIDLIYYIDSLSVKKKKKKKFSIILDTIKGYQS